MFKRERSKGYSTKMLKQQRYGFFILQSVNLKPFVTRKTNNSQFPPANSFPSCLYLMAERTVILFFTMLLYHTIYDTSPCQFDTLDYLNNLFFNKKRPF